MKWWIALAGLVAIGLAVWLARPALRPEPPRLGEYAIEDPPRAPGQSARDVTSPSLQPRTVVPLQPSYERTVHPIAVEDAPSPVPSVNPIHVTPGQLHLRNLAPPKTPSERFLKRLPKSEPYLKK